MSSDTTPGRLNCETIERLQTRIDVRTLKRGPATPFDYDVGQAVVRNNVFGGNLRIPIVYGEEVIYGIAEIEAETMDPRDDWQMLVIDLQQSGWPIEKARAVGIGLVTADKTATVDDDGMADVLMAIRQVDSTWTDAAGWDGDDIDALLEAIRRADEPASYSPPDNKDKPIICPHCGGTFTKEDAR